MRKIKKIEIVINEIGEKKTFTIKELTLRHLMDLSQTNSLLGGEIQKSENDQVVPGFSFINYLLALRPDIEKIISFSCDFCFKDLLDLSPSDIQLLFDGFKEVNSVFLGKLDELGILKIFKALIDDFTKSFSK